MSTQDSEVTVQRSHKAFWELVKVEGKLALREPVGVIFGIGLPVFLLIIFGSIPLFRNIVPGTTLSAFEVYIPILMVTMLIFIGLFGLPIPIVRDREIGWLRRISTTPVSPTKLLAAQVTINLILAGIAFTILTVGSVFFFGVKGSFEIPGFVLSIVLVTIALFSLGVLIASARSRAPFSHIIARDGRLLSFLRLHRGSLLQVGVRRFPSGRSCNPQKDSSLNRKATNFSCGI